MLGQIPYIAIDNSISDLQQSEDKHFTGTGQVLAPFDCYEVTGDMKFSGWLDLNQHFYVSRYPLYDDFFYGFYLKSDQEVLDKSQLDFKYYLQDEALTTGSFEFYYTRIGKPFKMSKIDLFNTIYPFTYSSREARTGIIPNVLNNLQTEQTEIIVPDDLIDNYLSHDDLFLLIDDRRNWSDNLSDEDDEIPETVDPEDDIEPEPIPPKSGETL